LWFSRLSGRISSTREALDSEGTLGSEAVDDANEDGIGGSCGGVMVEGMVAGVARKIDQELLMLSPSSAVLLSLFQPPP
jgi:hypothetical protein